LVTPGCNESVVTAAVMFTSTVFGSFEMLTRTAGLTASPSRGTDTRERDGDVLNVSCGLESATRDPDKPSRVRSVSRCARPRLRDLGRAPILAGQAPPARVILPAVSSTNACLIMKTFAALPCGLVMVVLSRYASRVVLPLLAASICLPTMARTQQRAGASPPTIELRRGLVITQSARVA